MPHLICSRAVACWPGPCCAEMALPPCCANVKALLHLQLCSSVTDTISNLLSHALFEWAYKLKCGMLFFFILFRPSISVYHSPLLHSRVLRRAWLCLWSFNIQPGSSVLTAVWERLCSAESSALPKKLSPTEFFQFISFPPTQLAKTSRRLLFTLRQYTTDLINNQI